MADEWAGLGEVVGELGPECGKLIGTKLTIPLN